MCNCGRCPRCARRAYMRRYRAAELERARKGTTADVLRQLDAIVSAGAAIDRTVAALDRQRLLALADRFELGPAPTEKLRVSVRRRLVGLGRVNPALGGDAVGRNPGSGIASDGASPPEVAGRDHSVPVVPALPSGGGR